MVDTQLENKKRKLDEIGEQVKEASDFVRNRKRKFDEVEEQVEKVSDLIRTR